MARELELPKPINIYETPAFQRRSQKRRNLIVNGISYGALKPEITKSETLMDQAEDDFQTARHELKHGSVIDELKNARKTRMSIIPGLGYRGVTQFAINPSIPVEQRAWIVLIASVASGIEDNISTIDYSHQGRGSDEDKGDYAANIISIVKYQGRVNPSSIKAEAQSIAGSIVSSRVTEIDVWDLVNKKEVA